MGESFYKKTAILLALSGVLAFFQNCSHLKKENDFLQNIQAEKVKPEVNKMVQNETPAKTVKIKKLNPVQTVENFNQTHQKGKLVTAFDFNNNGVLDIVYNNTEKSALEIYIKDGDSYSHVKSLPTSAPSYAEVLGLDLNSDGHLDLATVSTGGLVNIWLDSKSSERYYERLDFNTSLGISGPVYSISSGDVNGDGFIDIAVANTQNRLGGFVTILLNNGLGILSLKQIMIGEGLSPSKVDLVDLNSDGLSDLVFKSDNTEKIYIYKNDDGVFMKEIVMDFPEDKNLDLKKVAIQEFNQKSQL